MQDELKTDNVLLIVDEKTTRYCANLGRIIFTTSRKSSFFVLKHLLKIIFVIFGKRIKHYENDPIKNFQVDIHYYKIGKYHFYINRFIGEFDKEKEIKIINK